MPKDTEHLVQSTMVKFKKGEQKDMSGRKKKKKKF